MFEAFQFLLGDGLAGSPAPLTTNLQWQTFRGGSNTGSGSVQGLTKGTTVGWFDFDGIDELRGAFGTESRLW